MRLLVIKFLKERLNNCDDINDAADRVVAFIESKEFAERFAQRIKCPADLGLGVHVNLKWSIAMSALTDAMAAVGAAIKAAGTGIDPAHVAAIDEGIKALQEHDSAEDAEIKDVTDALTTLHDAVVPPATGPAPAPAPDSPPAA